ncbi:hypothetical protein E2C01_029134 [Portunus trituberculatus]|uniref:Uncharacterized protein n=1 Tax=Portunus trituberculatus TaxID=210409 RepID=A0A5B7ENC9_PORTR|nr:hypothetical protein [Portunus trituberculatus]
MRSPRFCSIEDPRINYQHLKTLSIGSFSRAGPKIFNSPPLYLRDMSACSVKVFKQHLDKFLWKIADATPCLHTRHGPTDLYDGKASYLMLRSFETCSKEAKMFSRVGSKLRTGAAILIGGTVGHQLKKYHEAVHQISEMSQTSDYKNTILLRQKEGLGLTLVWPRLHIYTYPIFL